MRKYSAIDFLVSFPIIGLCAYFIFLCGFAQIKFAEGTNPFAHQIAGKVDSKAYLPGSRSGPVFEVSVNGKYFAVPKEVWYGAAQGDTIEISYSSLPLIGFVRVSKAIIK